MDAKTIKAVKTKRIFMINTAYNNIQNTKKNIDRCEEYYYQWELDACRVWRNTSCGGGVPTWYSRREHLLSSPMSTLFQLSLSAMCFFGFLTGRYATLSGVGFRRFQQSKVLDLNDHYALDPIIYYVGLIHYSKIDVWAYKERWDSKEVVRNKVGVASKVKLRCFRHVKR